MVENLLGYFSVYVDFKVLVGFVLIAIVIYVVTYKPNYGLFRGLMWFYGSSKKDTDKRSETRNYGQLTKDKKER